MNDTYSIENSWMPMLVKGVKNPFPVVYFKSDENYEMSNNKFIRIKISGTNSSYDDLPEVLAKTSTSEFLPNYRKNYFEKTGYMALFLFTPFVEYPENFGRFTITKIEDNFTHEDLIKELVDCAEGEKIIEDTLREREEEIEEREKEIESLSDNNILLSSVNNDKKIKISKKHLYSLIAIGSVSVILIIVLIVIGVNELSK